MYDIICLQNPLILRKTPYALTALIYKAFPRNTPVRLLRAPAVLLRLHWKLLFSQAFCLGAKTYNFIHLVCFCGYTASRCFYRLFVFNAVSHKERSRLGVARRTQGKRKPPTLSRRGPVGRLVLWVSLRRRPSAYRAGPSLPVPSAAPDRRPDASAHLQGTP